MKNSIVFHGFCPKKAHRQWFINTMYGGSAAYLPEREDRIKTHDKRGSGLPQTCTAETGGYENGNPDFFTVILLKNTFTG